MKKRKPADLFRERTIALASRIASLEDAARAYAENRDQHFKRISLYEAAFDFAAKARTLGRKK